MHACTKKIGISESNIYDYSNDALKINQGGRNVFVEKLIRVPYNKSVKICHLTYNTHTKVQSGPMAK
jgi:hypothetical protein